MTTSFAPPARDLTPLPDEGVERYLSGLYDQIDFGSAAPLPYDVFNKAIRGFLNLHNEGRLSTQKDIVSICDFDLPSTDYRLWVIDLQHKKLLFNTYVAHGQGSGENYACAFSNEANSHQSSLGFYVTGAPYDGDHGPSLLLYGLDTNYNDAAFDRSIVVHGAKYVSEQFISRNDHLGRSWGCPAVPAELSYSIIEAIRDSTCLFIYSSDISYLRSATWLNRKVTAIPQCIRGGINLSVAPRIMHGVNTSF